MGASSGLAECGADVVYRRGVRDDDDTERVRVSGSSTPFEAHFFRTILVAEGIDAVVRREALAGLGGLLPFEHCQVEVWVPAKDAERAEALLRVQARTTEADHHCRGCGEANPPGFEICWKCDRVLVA